MVRRGLLRVYIDGLGHVVERVCVARSDSTVDGGMKLSISNALRIISGIWVLMSLLCLVLAVAAVVQNRYKDPVTFIGGAVCLLFGSILFLVSFIKTTNQSIRRNPFVATILWVVVILIGIWTLLGLYSVSTAFF